MILFKSQGENFGRRGDPDAEVHDGLFSTRPTTAQPNGARRILAEPPFARNETIVQRSPAM